MKKIFTILFAILITTSTFLFSACSNGTLKPINMSVYYNNNVSATAYKNDASNSKTLDITSLTSSKPDRSKMDKYTEKAVYPHKICRYTDKIQKAYFTRTLQP